MKVQAKGTLKIPRSAERSERLPRVLLVGLQNLGWAETYQTAQNLSSHSVLNLLFSGEPVEDVAHVDSDVIKLWHMANKTGSRAISF